MIQPAPIINDHRPGDEDDGEGDDDDTLHEHRESYGILLRHVVTLITLSWEMEWDGMAWNGIWKTVNGEMGKVEWENRRTGEQESRRMGRMEELGKREL